MSKESIQSKERSPLPTDPNDLDPEFLLRLKRSQAAKKGHESKRLRQQQLLNASLDEPEDANPAVEEPPKKSKKPRAPAKSRTRRGKKRGDNVPIEILIA